MDSTSWWKTLIDGIALTVTGAAFIKLMPAISALVTFIWVCIRILETRTVRGLLNRIRRLGKGG